MTVRAVDATYRVQLRPGFGFDGAAAIARYLADLGVSHLYASPYLQAAPGSTHGYDIVDPTRLNVELGGAEGLARLIRALAAAGLGHVLDVVPNHMAVTARDNAWWWDVLENGPSSVYAAYFDVDWDPPEAKLRDLVLLPILGDHYGRILEAGEFRLERDGGSFVVRYYDNAAPIAPRSLDELLADAARRLAVRAPATPATAELESIASAFGRLPPSWATDRQSVQERHRDKEVLRGRLADLCRAEPQVAAAIDAEAAAVTDNPDRLDALLERQNYRLAWWKTAAEEVDYRRFFDVSGLAAIRVEDDHVFADSHGLVLGLAAEGLVDGFRIDHIDGLRDPARYLRRLTAAAPDCYLVVEKILEAGETLPGSWPVAGTTGYDWLNLCGGLFVDRDGTARVIDGYARFTAESVDWPEIVSIAKGQAMHDALAADIARLAALLARVCEGHRRYRDYTRRDLHATLVAVIAAWPVYRTYVTEDEGASATDRASIETAIAVAADRDDNLDRELLDFVADLLLLCVPGEHEHELALRFQQVTGSVMAKGVEDTAFYRYLPLTSLNEVGGNPGSPSRFSTKTDTFHRACRDRQAHLPRSMLTTSTHDTKRSEDVRARINLLSELPLEWEATVARWSNLNRRHRTDDWPDRNTEWLLYQTLVGAWPIDAERVTQYLEKATREAKVHTSWTDPAAAYDKAVRYFAESTLADETFRSEIETFVADLTRPGWINSLAQKLLSLTGPGVPDLYQGSELWDLSLVDPDNRRPVDFAVRQRLLAELGDQVHPTEVWADEDGTGRSKLLVVSRALRLRRDHPDWFTTYQSLDVVGRAADHAVAFTRGGKAVTIVPRLPITLERNGGWQNTAVRLPSGRFRSALDNSTQQREGTVKLAELLADFPVALLRIDEP